MKDVQRAYPLFSLCGLNCGLCPIHQMGNGCPGCGGGEGHQSCSMVRCSQQHGGVEHCFECEEYPCARYDGIDTYDSFLPTRNMRRDLERVRTMGIQAYRAELDEKVERLEYLLDHYNDGRRKSFFCTAVNLLELEDIRRVMEQIQAEADPSLPAGEQAALAVGLVQEMARMRGISLKLNRKPRKKK